MTDPFREELAAALGDAYTLERELAGGGMSRVFVAVEQALGRRVVVKVLPPDLAAGVNSERFRREIQLAAQLQHPHVVPLLAAGESGRLLYYTMPFIEGESLRATLDRQGRLPVRDVMRILVDVVEALAYAHDRGVIHRDIKPGNVLMLGSHALITDFGVAKALNAALPSSGGTSTGMAIGTPAYMAPEQLAGDPTADHRVDLYAVGLLAYELVTGRSPFASASPQATMAAQLTRDPDPLDRSYPDVPPALARLVSSCLQKDAGERPPTARALLQELEAFATPADATVRIATAPRRRRLAGLAAVAGIVVAAGAAVAAYVTLESRTPVPLPVAGDSAPGDAVASSLEVTRPRDTVYLGQPVSSGRALTRADSLAIAAAVEQRGQELRGSGISEASIDSLMVVMTRRVGDSLARLVERAEAFRSLGRLGQQLAAPGAVSVTPRLPDVARTPRSPQDREDARPPQPASPPRIVVLDFANGTGIPELGPLGVIGADSLRATLAARGGVDVVDAATVRRAHASGNRLLIERLMRSSVMIEGTILRTRGDSIHLLFRVKAPDGASRTVRSGRMPAISPTLDFSAILQLLDRVAPPSDRRPDGSP